MAYKTRQATEALDRYLNIKSTDKKYIPDTKQRGIMLQLQSGEHIVIFVYPLVHKQDNTKNYFDTRDSGAYERGVAWKFAMQYHMKFFCFGVNDEVGKYKDYVFSLECNEAKIEWVSGTKNGVRNGAGNQIIIPNDYVPVKKFERITNKLGIFIAVVHKDALWDYLDKYDNRPYMEDEEELRKLIHDLVSERQEVLRNDAAEVKNVLQSEAKLGVQNVILNEAGSGEQNVLQGGAELGEQNILQGGAELGIQNILPGKAGLDRQNMLPNEAGLEGQNFVQSEAGAGVQNILPNEAEFGEQNMLPNEAGLGIQNVIQGGSGSGEQNVIQSGSALNRQNRLQSGSGSERQGMLTDQARITEAEDFDTGNGDISRNFAQKEKPAVFIPPVYYTHIDELLEPPGRRYERNRIVFGAPGTGKSHRLKKDAGQLLDCNEGTFERVTFHPDYTYSQFVGTYKPVSKGGDIEYEFVPGPFMRIYAEALESGRGKAPKPHLLLIEEINRAKVAAVFGDVFQLLDRDENGVSEYEIHASEDIRRYLADQLGGEPDNYKKIQLPDNMFIWATMNSADQGVFAMDTAFKRRWNFEYIGINENDKDIRCGVMLGAHSEAVFTDWNRLRRALNDKLAYEYKVNEDKLMGPYFLSRDVIRTKEGESDQEMPQPAEAADRDYFIQSFKSKVIMYLYEDAAKQYKHKLFSGSGCDSSRYSAVCEAFEKMGMRIFGDDFKEKYYDVQEG